MNKVIDKQRVETYMSDAVRWSAVLSRDGKADGMFFYGVRTTGVYCRPTCGSRLPRRENVRFYATCADAERAGYRACKRCRPLQDSAAEDHAEAVARTCRLIEESCVENTVPNLDTLAAAAGMSRFHFHRVFKRCAGVTPKAYAVACRAQRVRALGRRESITETIYASGFASSGRFYENSTAILGMTPTKYKEGGACETIRFAVGQCSLGAILVAATEVGVCSILLGDDPRQLVRDLQNRFPRAEIKGADRAFEAMVARVVGFVEQPAHGLTLPLDVRGTAFQHRVWQALRKIPAGKTATYTQIARAVGAPKAVRAVASACAANPIAVAIPCHRVVRTSGALAGYRWGIARKSTLLERERRNH
jgi:AraC family transcriptional regulator, regulatory protein of adaptative response / methylated-DNA-[protein]-cysteine methyltransferase